LNEKGIRFTFDGKRYRAVKGDTVAEALYRNGARVLTRSVKFHRPRGLHCGSGDCPNCLVNVDGVPNVRSCITPVSEGMRVRSQNRVISLRFDPVSLMDHLFKRGFDYYHRFIRPTFARGVYQSVIRHMAGIGEVPNVDVPTESTRRIRVDALIIGDGAAAKRAAERCTSARLKGVVKVKSVQGPPSNQQDQSGLDDSTVVGAFDDGDILVSNGRKLHIILPGYVILAEEGRERPLTFPNWDIPGILRETAALRLIGDRVALGKKVFITGDVARCERVADMIRSSDAHQGEITIIKPGWRILAAYGRNSIHKIVISDANSKTTSACDCLITCNSQAPRIDIARQLGCEIVTKGKSSPTIKIDESFETSRKNVFAIGGSANIFDVTTADRSAEIAVDRIISSMREAGP